MLDRGVSVMKSTGLLASLYLNSDIAYRTCGIARADKARSRINKRVPVSTCIGGGLFVLRIIVIDNVRTVIGIERSVKRGVAGKRSAALGEDIVADREDDDGIRRAGLRNGERLGIAAVDDIAGIGTGNADIGCNSRGSIGFRRNARYSVLIERVLCKGFVLVGISSVYTLRAVVDGDGISVVRPGRSGELHLTELRLADKTQYLRHDVDDRRNELVLVGVQRPEKIIDYVTKLGIRDYRIKRIIVLSRYRSRKHRVEDIGDKSHDALLEGLSGEYAGCVSHEEVGDAGQILIDNKSVEDGINNILEDSLAAAVGEFCGKN